MHFSQFKIHVYNSIYNMTLTENGSLHKKTKILYYIYKLLVWLVWIIYLKGQVNEWQMDTLVNPPAIGKSEFKQFMNEAIISQHF